MSSENEDEEFDFDEELEDEGFESFDGGSSSGGGLKNNPLVKIAIVLGAFAALFVGITMLGGSNETPQSRTPEAPDVTEAPGGDISPEIKKAIETTNVKRREEAEATGKSAIPVPVGPSRSTDSIQNENIGDNDPLARWRQIQQQRLAEQQLKRQQQQSQVPQQPQPKEDNTQAINELAKAMQGQMQQVISEQQPTRIQNVFVTDSKAYFSQKQQEQVQQQQRRQQQTQQQQVQQQQAQQQAPEVLIPAGTIEYGQLLLEANTDAPGPVLAQIVSGPLKGSRLLGSFETQRNFLTLQFSSAIVNDQSVSIQAVAINPETNTPGIVTEIDRRYFSRVVLPTAASFVEGFGTAVAEAGQTTVTVDDGAAVEEQEDLDTREELFSAAADAGARIGEIIDEEAGEIQPLLRIASGTPIALLFISPVLDPETVPQQQGQFGQGQFGQGQLGQQRFGGGAATQQNSGQFVNPFLVNQRTSRVLENNAARR